MSEQALNASENGAWHGTGAADPPADFEKRQLPRQRSIFRVARVSADSGDGFARVLNISDEGLKLGIHLPIEPGSALQIDLSETVRLNGEVVWVDGKNCGVKLTDPIDSAATLVRLLAESVRVGDRPLRLPCASEAVAKGEFGTCHVLVEDVSLRGMKVQHDGAFKEGARVRIFFGSIREREGIVRWSRENRAGVALVEPFSPEELGSVENSSGRME